MEIEDSLERLDKLTQEEARMASAELLKIAHNVDDGVKGVDGKVQDVHRDLHDVGNRVQDVSRDVHDVGNKVQGVNDRVQAIDSDVKDISCDVREVNRSLTL